VSATTLLSHDPKGLWGITKGSVGALPECTTNGPESKSRLHVCGTTGYQTMVKDKDRREPNRVVACAARQQAVWVF
jgi:hypothetical protein